MYSPNDGGSWITLTSGLTTTSYTLDTTLIADGTYILLKVHAVDSVGFIAQTVSTTSFIISNDQLTIPTVLSPNGGETLTGSVTLTWTAALDSNDHSVSYTVYYSSDEGATWTELTSGLTTTSYSWDTTTAPNGFSYLVKIIATCSEGLSAEDVSDDTFAVYNEIETETTTTTTLTSDVTIPGLTSLILIWALGTWIVVRKKQEK